VGVAGDGGVEWVDVSYVRAAKAPGEKAVVGGLGDAHGAVGEVAHGAQLAGVLALVG